MTRVRPRGRGVRIVALAAGLITTGTAYAATTPAAQDNTNVNGVTISATKAKVRYGQQLPVSGRAAGTSVKLEYAPAGQGWRPVAQAATGPQGSYRFTVRPRLSGAYRAVGESGGASAPKRVAVVARLKGRASRHVHRGSPVRVRGRVAPGQRGRAVRLQVRSGRGWKTVKRARTGAGGLFRASWRPQRTGSFQLRVRFSGDRLNAAASRTLASRVHVYRPSQASWYGPGLYGNALACGGRLSAGTLGVANRTLPCGTKVTLRYGSRSVTVPVIDRGPFSGSREWDLTAATKSRLGFPDTGVVWTTK
jgi:rare lipoprotein A